MHKFLVWALDKAQKSFVEEVEYEGDTYEATYTTFKGMMKPSRVKQLCKEIGDTPVNEELHQVVCKWGGNYISEAGYVRVSQVVFQKVL